MYVYLYRSGRGWYWLADHTWTHQKDLVHFSRPTVRRRHSTDTDLFRVVNNLNTSMESGSKSVLLSLDISAAFNTIDADKLLLRLEYDFWLCELASAWFQSYLTGRSCYMAIGDLRSDVGSCDSGIPQEFKRPWTCPLLRLRISHLKDRGVSRDQVSSIRRRYSTRMCALWFRPKWGLSRCVLALTLWFLDDGLQLNSSKSEAMIHGSRQDLSRLEPLLRWSLAMVV